MDELAIARHQRNSQSSIAQRHVPRFFLRQRFGIKYRCEVLAAGPDGEHGELIAFVEEEGALGSAPDKFRFFGDESKTERLFSCTPPKDARDRYAGAGRDYCDNVMCCGPPPKNVFRGARFDVVDSDSSVIGWFRRDYVNSRRYSRWHLHCGGVSAVRNERDPVEEDECDITPTVSAHPLRLGSVVLGIFDFLYPSFLSVLKHRPPPFTDDNAVFDFTDPATGAVVMSVSRQRAKSLAVKHCEVSVADPRVCFGFAAAIATVLKSMFST